MSSRISSGDCRPSDAVRRLEAKQVIPVCEPFLEGKEDQYVSECVRTGWISSSGPFIEQFEQQWSAYCGRSYGVAVCNGTAALWCAVASLNLQPGDEVVIPSFTIMSCAQAIIACGGTPVLVDSDPDTWTMDVAAVESRITPRTRAIMPVHIYGHPVNLDPILSLAKEQGLMVIEDAAEAHGAEYQTALCGGSPAWHRCGGFGDMSCFSFYANKPVTTGEGGMVVTDDPVMAAKLRSLRNLCFGNERRFVHESLGFNFRLTNLQAALGVAQIERIDEIVGRKRAIGKAYVERLGSVAELQLQQEQDWARSVFWMNGVVLADDVDMDAALLGRLLKQNGVDTRPFFVGMHEQPVLRERGLFQNEACPVATRLARRGLYLPSGAGLTMDEVNEVCDTLQEVLP